MANMLDIVQYIVLHPLFSIITFYTELFKNFEEQVNGFSQRHRWQFSKNLGLPA